jgi:tetratricopeptide (TPR) repeat protein
MRVRVAPALISLGCEFDVGEWTPHSEDKSMLCAMRLALVLVVAACSREPRDPLSLVAADVRAGRFAEVASRIATTELPERPALAFRAASEAKADALPALAAAAVEPELATAVGDRLEQEGGPQAALVARERAATVGPDRAERHDALARARLAAGQNDAALAAWDRAATLAPLQPQYRLAPIRALVVLGDRERACARAAAIAAGASDVERLLVASTAAAACGNHAQAIELARDARDRRPGDGRLTFTLGERLADAADPTAADVLAELLVCGAHGRAWHRHEVAARLVGIATDVAAARGVLAAMKATRTCAVVDPEELTGYLESLRAKLTAVK